MTDPRVLSLKTLAQRMQTFLADAGHNPLGPRRALDVLAAAYGTNWNVLTVTPLRPLMPERAAAEVSAALIRLGVFLSAAETARLMDVLNLSTPPLGTLIVLPGTAQTPAPWPLLPGHGGAETLALSREHAYGRVDWQRDGTAQLGMAVFGAHEPLRDRGGERLNAWYTELQGVIGTTSHHLSAEHDPDGTLRRVTLHRGLSATPHTADVGPIAPLTVVCGPAHMRRQVTLGLAYAAYYAAYSCTNTSFLYLRNDAACPLAGHAAHALRGPCLLTTHPTEARRAMRLGGTRNTLTLSDTTEDWQEVALFAQARGIRVVLDTSARLEDLPLLGRGLNQQGLITLEVMAEGRVNVHLGWPTPPVKIVTSLVRPGDPAPDVSVHLLTDEQASSPDTVQAGPERMNIQATTGLKA